MEPVIYLIVGIALLYLLRKFLKGPKAIRVNMKGKVVIITGASSGIGKETAIQLLEDEATVVFACRDKKKTLQVIENIVNKVGKSSQERAIFMELELSSFSSVDKFVAEIKSKFNSIDILINNAGYIAHKYEITNDKIEAMAQTNHYSHVKLTLGLLDLFKSSEGRIINVSSLAHNFSNYATHIKTCFGPDKDQFKDFFTVTGSFVSYGNTKLANIYFGQYLAKRFENEKKYNHLAAYSLHPGAVDTEFTNGLTARGKIYYIITKLLAPAITYFMKNPNDGAQTTLHLCYSKLNDLKNGGYYQDCSLGKLSKTAKDESIRDYLMTETLKVFNN